MSQDTSPTRPHDALDGGRAQTTERESRDRGVQESGAKIGRRNSTGLGRAVRAGSAVRVGSAARVVGGARAGKGPRAVGVMRPRCAAGMRCRNPESGRPNVGGRNPAGPLATPWNRVDRAPSSQHPAVKCQTSLNWRRKWWSTPKATSGDTP